jgi:hypothetical protein
MGKSKFVKIRTFEADKFKKMKGIELKDFTEEPCDIVACRDPRRLYVAQSNCIWRVSWTKSKSLFGILNSDEKCDEWLSLRDDDSFHIKSMSMTSRQLVLTSGVGRQLRQYSDDSDKPRLMRTIQLPENMKSPRHAVRTSQNTFILCYAEAAQSQQQKWAVITSSFYN